MMNDLPARRSTRTKTLPDRLTGLKSAACASVAALLFAWTGNGTPDKPDVEQIPPVALVEALKTLNLIAEQCGTEDGDDSIPARAAKSLDDSTRAGEDDSDSDETALKNLGLSGPSPSQLAKEEAQEARVLRKALDDFCAELAKAHHDKDRWPLPGEMLNTLFARGYDKQAAQFRKALDDALGAAATNKTGEPPTVTVDSTQTALASVLVPARFFIADEFSRLPDQDWDDPRKIGDAVTCARKRLLETEARVERLRRLVAAAGPLERLLPVREYADRLRDHERVFSSYKREQFTPQGSPAPATVERYVPSAHLEEAMKLEGQLRAASAQIDKMCDELRTKAGTAIAAAERGIDEVRQLGAALANPKMALYWKLIPERMGDDGRQVYTAELFLRVQGARRVTLTDITTKEPKSESGEAADEWPLGYKQHGVIKTGPDSIGVLPETLGWKKDWDAPTFLECLRRMGVPAWLVRDADMRLQNNRLIVRLFLLEPDLGAFGLKPGGEEEPLEVPLDIFHPDFSLERDLIEGLKKQALSRVTRTWARLEAHMHQWSALRLNWTIERPENPDADGSAGAPDPGVVRRIVRASRGKDEFVSFTAEIDPALSRPRVRVSGFKVTDAARAFLRQEAFGKVQKQLAEGEKALDEARDQGHLEEKLGEFATLSLQGGADDSTGADGLYLEGALSLSLEALKTALVVPPALTVRVYPFAAADKMWQVRGSDWRAWYGEQKKRLRVALSDAVRGTIAKQIAKLEGHEFPLPAGMKLQILAPLTYLPEEKKCRVSVAVKFGSPGAEPLQITNLLLIGGYDPETDTWTLPKFQYSGAEIKNPPALEEALRRLLGIADVKEEDRKCRLRDLHLDGRGLVFRLALRLPELDVDMETEEIVIDPSKGPEIDLRALARTALRGALEKALARGGFSIKGYGPVESVSLDAKKTRFDDSGVEVWLLAKAKLFDQKFDLPVRAWPGFACDGDAARQVLLGQLNRWFDKALKVKLPNLEVNPREPFITENPLRAEVTVKFKLPGAFLIEIDPVVITQQGVELPERLKVGVGPLGEMLNRAIQSLTSHYVVLAEPGATFYLKNDCGRIDFTGKLTIGHETAAKAVCVDVQVQTNVASFSSLQLGLKGDLVVGEKAHLLTITALLNLREGILTGSADPGEAFDKVVKPSMEARLDFRQRSFTDKLSLRLLGMEAGGVDFKVALDPDNHFTVGGTLKVDILVGKLNGWCLAKTNLRSLSWKVGADADINVGLKVGDASMLASNSGAKFRLKVLGIPFRLGVAAPNSLTPEMIWDLVSGLFSFDPKSLEAILHGNIQIVPGGKPGPGGGESTASNSSDDSDDDGNQGKGNQAANGQDANGQKEENPVSATGSAPQPGSSPAPPPAAGTTPPWSGVPNMETNGNCPPSAGVATWVQQNGSAVWWVSRSVDGGKSHDTNWGLQTVTSRDGATETAQICVGVAGGKAYACAFYRGNDAAKNDPDAPVLILPDIASCGLAQGKEPSALVTALLEELVRRVDLKQPAKAAGVHCIWKEGGAPARTGAAYQDYGYQAAVVSDDNGQDFLLAPKGTDEVRSWHLDAKDPLLGNLLPAFPAGAAEPATSDGQRQFLGQYAWLVAGASWRLLDAREDAAAFVRPDRVAVLGFGGNPVVQDLHVGRRTEDDAWSRAQGRAGAPPPPTTPVALETTMRAAGELFIQLARKAWSPGAKSDAGSTEIFTDSASPHRLLFVHNDGARWSVETCASTSAAPAATLFSPEEAARQGKSLTRFGEAVYLWMTHPADLGARARSSYLCGCPTGFGNAHRNPGLPADTHWHEFDGCSGGKLHWAFWMQRLAGTSGATTLVWKQLEGFAAGATAGEGTIPVPPKLEAAQDDEVRRGIKKLVAALAQLQPDDKHLDTVTRELEAASNVNWEKMETVDGGEILKRYLHWRDDLKDVYDTDAVHDLVTPSDRAELARLATSGRKDWQAKFKADPLGLIKAEPEPEAQP